MARTFNILNPNGMKDSTTITAEPNAQAVVDADERAANGVDHRSDLPEVR